MTPLGYMHLRDAIKRAAEAWDGNEKDAYERLRPHLHAGELESIVQFSNGDSRPVCREWGGRLADDAYLDGYLRWDTGRIDDARAQAFVQSAGLETFLENQCPKSEPPIEAITSLSNPPVSKGGRPSEYDWEGMLIEAARLIYFDGIPASESDLRKRLLEWFSATHGREPSPNAIKPKVARLWKELDRDDRQ